MKAISISAKDVISLIDVPENGERLYQIIHKVVDGRMENVYPRRLPEGYVMIVNEEGRLLGLPVNPIGSYLYQADVHGESIVGDVIVLKLGYYQGEPDVIGIPDKEANGLMNNLLKILRGAGR